MRKDQIDRKKKHLNEEIKDDNDQLKKIEELNHKVAFLKEKIDVYKRNEHELLLDREKLAKIYGGSDWQKRRTKRLINKAYVIENCMY